jgi:hypothetical protein
MLHRSHLSELMILALRRRREPLDGVALGASLVIHAVLLAALAFVQFKAPPLRSVDRRGGEKRLIARLLDPNDPALKPQQVAKAPPRSAPRPHKPILRILRTGRRSDPFARRLPPPAPRSPVQPPVVALKPSPRPDTPPAAPTPDDSPKPVQQAAAKSSPVNSARPESTPAIPSPPSPKAGSGEADAAGPRSFESSPRPKAEPVAAADAPRAGAETPRPAREPLGPRAADRRDEPPAAAAQPRAAEKHAATLPGENAAAPGHSGEGSPRQASGAAAAQVARREAARNQVETPAARPSPAGPRHPELLARAGGVGSNLPGGDVHTPGDDKAAPSLPEIGAGVPDGAGRDFRTGASARSVTLAGGQVQAAVAERRRGSGTPADAGAGPTIVTGRSHPGAVMLARAGAGTRPEIGPGGYDAGPQRGTPSLPDFGSALEMGPRARAERGQALSGGARAVPVARLRESTPGSGGDREAARTPNSHGGGGPYTDRSLPVRGAGGGPDPGPGNVVEATGLGGKRESTTGLPGGDGQPGERRTRPDSGPQGGAGGADGPQGFGRPDRLGAGGSGSDAGGPGEGAGAPRAGGSGGITLPGVGFGGLGAPGGGPEGEPGDGGEGGREPGAKQRPGGVYVNTTGDFDVPLAVTSSDYQFNAGSLSRVVDEINGRTKIKVKLGNQSTVLRPQAMKPAPVLVFNGHKPFRLTPEQRDAVRAFVARGGLIWADFTGGKFDESFAEEMHEIFGRDLAAIGPGHAIYQSFYRLDRIPPGDTGLSAPFQGIAVNGRLAVVATRNRYLGAVAGPPHVSSEVQEGAFQALVNIYVYAAQNFKANRDR